MNEQVKISLVAFNFAVMMYMLFQIIRYMVNGSTWTLGWFFLHVLIAVILGAIVGGITYFVSSR